MHQAVPLRGQHPKLPSAAPATERPVMHQVPPMHPPSYARRSGIRANRRSILAAMYATHTLATMLSVCRNTNVQLVSTSASLQHSFRLAGISGATTDKEESRFSAARQHLQRAQHSQDYSSCTVHGICLMCSNFIHTG